MIKNCEKHSKNYILPKINNNKSNNNSNDHKVIPSFMEIECNNTMSQFGPDISMASGMHPYMLNVPIAQQLSVSNSFPPLINQIQTIIPHNHEEVNELRFVHTTSVPLSERFESQSSGDFLNSNSNSIETGIKRFNSRMDYKRNTGNIFHQNRLNFNNDLRHLLSTKRLANSINAEPKKHSNIPRISSNKEYHKEDLNNIHSTNAAVFKINVSNLKNIAKQGEHDKYWYIVPDTNVFINHHKFLKLLLDSDEECHLMVIENIVTHIRCASRSTNSFVKTKSLQALSFISGKIKAGSATITKNPIVENNTGSYFLECCLKLIDENYQIVVLCNDKNLQSYDSASRLPIFTVNEMKSFLSNNVIEDEIQNDKSSFNTLQSNDSRRIRITISNDDSEDLTALEYDTMTLMTDNSFDINDSVPVTVSVGVQTNNVTQVKSTVDVEVQTEINSEVLSRIFSIGTNTRTLLATSKNFDEEQDKTNSDTSLKMKEIKLNRTISTQSAKHINDKTDKINFKWRRKRPICLVPDNDASCGQEMNTNIITKKPKLNKKSEMEQSDDITNISKLPAPNTKRNNYADNGIVKETSTSGVISNAPSCLNVESEINEKREPAFSSENTKTGKNIMFDVTSQTMGEHLKTRCDEWVSRFIQTMEEVLTQILQTDTLSFSNSLKPPWTLVEATQCIKMKFREVCDIVDATNKLSEILLKISDNKGSINIHIEPKQYMEMYSYGVYLIDSLQVADSNSDDLHIASESLAKLLNDIQNPTNYNDSFGDINREAVVDVNRETEVLPAAVNRDVSLEQEKACPANITSSTLYNLKWQRKRGQHNNNDETTQVKCLRNTDIETTFFKSLNLRKKIKACENNYATEVHKTISPRPDSPMLDHEPVRIEITSDTNVQLSEPKIIRNFTRCPDFEIKLKNIEKEMLRLHDIDESADPYLDYEYTGDDNMNIRPRTSANHCKRFKFKDVMRRLLREIRETFLLVYAFCAESQKRLCASSCTKSKAAILQKAKETHLNITKLCCTLKSINNRRGDSSKYNIAAILKSNNKGLEYNKCDLQKYKEIIAKCVEQANILNKTVETIMCHAE